MSLALIAAGIGTGLSAYATLEEGKQAAELGKTAQQQHELEAKALGEAGQYESREKRKEAIRARAAREAQVGAQGGELVGSKVIGIADEAVEYEADARVIMRNYQIEAIRQRNIGRIKRYQGQVARRASRIRAFAGAAGSIGKMYMMAYSPATSKPTATMSSTTLRNPSYATTPAKYRGGYTRNF